MAGGTVGTAQLDLRSLGRDCLTREIFHAGILSGGGRCGASILVDLRATGGVELWRAGSGSIRAGNDSGARRDCGDLGRLSLFLRAYSGILLSCPSA
jgi:hypothetical protein